MNAIRQAALVSDSLCVGVHSDDAIAQAKGPSILNLKERCAIIESSHFATRLAIGTPYELSDKHLDIYECDHYVHGDDPCTDVNGVDLLAYFTNLGRFKMIKRTTGVSTTDVTGKLLSLLEASPLKSLEAPKQ